MRFVCVSDTHGQHWNLSIPKGDVFIFCGDAEINSPEALRDFNIWLGSIPCTEKIFIAGNHDIYLPSLSFTEIQMTFTNAIYLENSSCEINGIKFWGSPYSPIFNDWAWMLNSSELEKIWSTIPEDTDFLLTHTPPFGILAETPFSKFTLGCPTLLKRVEEIKPDIHCFGHIHNGNGELIKKDTRFINCSVLNDWYKLVNKPKVFYFEK